MELAREEPVYEDVASKFWEHFLHIANAMNDLGTDGDELWDNADGFFYDYLNLGNGKRIPLQVRSMVGLIPLLAVETMESEQLDRMSGFKTRFEWFMKNRPDLTKNVACMVTRGQSERRLLSIVDKEQLVRVLTYMLDEAEFLSPHGIRSVSRAHKDKPYTLHVDGQAYSVDYEPGESTTSLFGGNSNWRGPVWWPINYLLVEALQKYHYYYGDEVMVEYPTGSGNRLNLWDVSQELSRRMTGTFRQGEDGRRPVYGGVERFQTDPNWKDLIQFHEYFHGETGAGLGASHQTGWTGLVAKMLQQSGE
jgi:glycogen debranching enzyme